MKAPEGERLDDALDLFHDHRWVENKPQVSDTQLAELMLALWPWFAEELAPPRRRQQRRPAGTVTSSGVPARIREAVLRRDGHACQRCGVSLYGRRYSLQHRDARGMGGSKSKHTMANLVALCGSATTGCHGHVESEPIESNRDGWSVPNGADPEDWPLLRWGKKWWQPGDGWSESLPHPRQIEMGASVEGAA